MTKFKYFLAMTLSFAAVASLVLGPSMEQVIAQDAASAVPGTVGSAPSAQVSSPSILKRFVSFPNAEFVQAGIGLRDVGSGTISVHAPTGAGVSAGLVAAYLYWSVIDTGTSTKPTHSQISTISFNGQVINGTRVGTDISPCWATPSNIYIYRAVVTGILGTRGGQLDDQYVSIVSAQTGGASPFDVPAVVPMAESAHLIVVYRSSSTTSTVQIFDGAGATSGLTFSGGVVATTVPLPAYVAGKQAAVGYALADGQHNSLFPKSAAWNTPTITSTTLLSGEAFGNDPSITSKASLRGSLSDTPQFDLSSHGLISVGDTSGTLTWNFNSDCLTTVAVTTED